MKKLGLVMAAATMAALGGCGSNGSDQGNFQVSWFETSNGANATCSDVGATYFELDATDTFSGQTDTFIYPCSQGSATLDALPSDTYSISASLLDGGKHPISTLNVTSGVILSAGEVVTLTPIGFEFSSQGQFRVTWSETVQGSAASCASVSAVTFSITATNLATGQPDIFRYNCSQGGATLDALDAGDYSITASLLDAGDVEVAGPTPDITGTIDGGSITDLGNFAFDFQ